MGKALQIMGCICVALLLFCSNGLVWADEKSLTSSNIGFDLQSIAERQFFGNDCEHVTPTQLICPCHCPLCQSPLCPTTPPPPQGCPCQTNKIIIENNAVFKPTMESCAASCIGACKFWTYNLPSRGCALRYFAPTARAFSLGNFSGKRNEPSTSYSIQVNSVWVAKKTNTQNCQQCSLHCKADTQCKSVIFNRAFRECSFNYGNNGPLTAISLPPQFSSFGIASAYKMC